MITNAGLAYGARAEVLDERAAHKGTVATDGLGSPVANGVDRDGAPRIVGVLRGEGIGPEVVGAALTVLDAVAGHNGLSFDVRICEGPMPAGGPLAKELEHFCDATFADGGVVICGPAGGSFRVLIFERASTSLQVGTAPTLGGARRRRDRPR